MLDMSWKWKLNDKRTQDRYVERGLLEKDKVQGALKNLPDLSAQATWVEMDMEEGQVSESETTGSSEHGSGESHT